MHKLTKKLPTTTQASATRLAVVEIRPNAPRTGLDPKAVQLLRGSFEDAELPYNEIATYSLTSRGSINKDAKEELLTELAKGGYGLILAIGAEAMHLLCNTKKTLEKYAGALTWNADLETWVLPSQHPSVVYVGPRETLNSRYDKFDFLFDHIHRAAGLVKGEIEFPPVEGHDIPWEFIGHDGTADADGLWSGYYETTEVELTRAQAVFTSWLDLLDSDRTGEDKGVRFAVDTESHNLNVFKVESYLMLQVYDGETAYAFNAGVVLHPQVKPLVQLFLGHGQARFLLWNTKYDRQVLTQNYGVSLEERDLDGMMLALGTTEKAKQCGLKYRSRQDQNAPHYEEALDEYLDQNNINYGHIPPHVLALYGCKDVFYTYEEIPILLKRVRTEGTMKAVAETLMPAQRTLADVEFQGMSVDLEYAQRTSAEWEPIIDAAVEAVQAYAREQGFPLDPDITGGQSYKAACECVPVRGQFHLEGKRVSSFAKALRGADFRLDDCGNCANRRYRTYVDSTLNVKSSKQMNHLCFAVLGMKRLPYDEESCAKEFWSLNANHPLAKLVAEYKELLHVRNNFLEGIQQFIAEDGKVHPDFLLFGTKTGRLAVKRPAVQTLPQHGTNAKAAKRIFVADDLDCLVVNCDYKSLEMFIAHHLTGDPVLLANLLSEWDVHTALAAVVYDKAPEDVTKEERQSVKSVNFGAGYGISGFKLSLDPAMEAATGGDPDKAQEFIDAFWNMYAVWDAKCTEWRAQAHDVQYLTTEMGRKRRWNLITKDNRNKVNNQAINFPGQSMASDLCLRSLIACHRELQDRGWGRVLLTVHDSLVFNIRKEFLHEAVELIQKIMTTPPFETETPFAVDVTVGVNYGDQFEYDPEKDYVNM